MDSSPERSIDATQENDIIDSASETDGTQQVDSQRRPETGSSSDRATDTEGYDNTDEANEESDGMDGLDDSETMDRENSEPKVDNDSEVDADDESGNDGDNSSRTAEDDQPATPASTSTDPAGSGSDGDDAESAASSSSSGRKRPRSPETQPPLKRFRSDDSNPGHASEDGDATTADERETEPGTDELADEPEGLGSDDRGTEVPLSEIPGTSGQKRPRNPETPQPPPKRIRVDSSAGQPAHAPNDGDATTAAGRETDDPQTLESGTDDSAQPAPIGQQGADPSPSTDREMSTEEDVTSSESLDGDRVAAGSDSIHTSDVQVLEVPGGTGDSCDGHTAEVDAGRTNTPGKKSKKRSWCTIS